ncbi:U32 family peptidase [Oribacterium sp. oral taxon 102]|uniref:peptidase U32 family protein n=1 Tax=Oribacterium sp. oral taxon 102 TaxID=671214 RepID=UPI0015BB1A9C|nr:U32 family peptidase [Oribacterium sp. oral taxon 102]NWO21474.1 U32 family peptidase [Oribacterium sp. oral taxon 102]
MRQTELLAPAGSLASVYAAVNAGADAVYMGGRRFGARAYAESAQALASDMLLAAIEHCHLFGVKLYMTINILFKDAELKELFSYLYPYYAAGVDGVIVQDLGAVRRIRELFPDLPVHASTQMCVSGPESARLVKRLGMTRAVLARELSLSEIHRIHEEAGIELEVFVHGAMCYSYSGECFMSSLLGGRSGNRGRCAGTCRLCYETGGKRGYFLSMKDMSTVELLPELISAGVYSMKIEGRMKSPVYTAGVVSVYRKYLDLAEKSPETYQVEERDLLLLRELYDRGGTDSYLRKHNDREMIAIKEKGFRVVDEQLLDEVSERYVRRTRQLPTALSIRLRAGEPMQLRAAAGEQAVTVVSSAPVERAQQSGSARESIEKQLRKTGATVFFPERLEIDMEEGLFVPVSGLNALRRAALEQLKEALLGNARRQGREVETGE